MELQPFAPVVNVFDTMADESIVRTVLVECPGVHEDDATWEQSEEGVALTIRKSLLVDTADVAKGAVKPLEPLRQQLGVYTETFAFNDFTFQEDCTLERGVLTLTWRKKTSVRRGTGSAGRRIRTQHFKLTPRTDTARPGRNAAVEVDAPSLPSSLGWSDRDHRSEVDSIAAAPETPPDLGFGNEVTDASQINQLVPNVVARIEGRSDRQSLSMPPAPFSASQQ